MFPYDCSTKAVSNYNIVLQANAKGRRLHQGKLLPGALSYRICDRMPRVARHCTEKDIFDSGRTSTDKKIEGDSPQGY